MDVMLEKNNEIPHPIPFAHRKRLARRAKRQAQYAREISITAKFNATGIGINGSYSAWMERKEQWETISNIFEQICDKWKLT